jgi:hypothetical protein
MKKLNALVVQESMEKTVCFRMKKHMDESLRELSKASSIPVSSLIRHCVITEAPKLAKQYGITINGN